MSFCSYSHNSRMAKLLFYHVLRSTYFLVMGILCFENVSPLLLKLPLASINLFLVWIVNSFIRWITGSHIIIVMFPKQMETRSLVMTNRVHMKSYNIMSLQIRRCRKTKSFKLPKIHLQCSKKVQIVGFFRIQLLLMTKFSQSEGKMAFEEENFRWNHLDYFIIPFYFLGSSYVISHSFWIPLPFIVSPKNFHF